MADQTVALFHGSDLIGTTRVADTTRLIVTHGYSWVRTGGDCVLPNTDGEAVPVFEQDNGVLVPESAVDARF